MKMVKRILALVMCLALCFAFTACGSETETVDDNTVKTEGSLTLTYKEFKIVKDNSGNDALMVKFNVKNDTNKSFLVKSSVAFSAIQGTETLARAIVIEKADDTQDNIESSVASKADMDAVVFFAIKDSKTAVKFTMTSKVGENKDPVTQEITLGA